jgi:putative phosphoribosyl transferase
MADPSRQERAERAVNIPADNVTLQGDLSIPPNARGLVVFAHGSGSSRMSPRNRAVARVLRASGFGTLLMDLLTADEDALDERTRELRFDIGLLARRLVAATDWVANADVPEARGLSVGYFGASTGAAAALVAAAERHGVVRAVVSRGGRPDLAGRALGRVVAPTLLIVGGLDDTVIDLNRDAMTEMTATAVTIEIVPGASHLFEEPGTLESVARLATAWFEQNLASASTRAAGAS